MLKWGILILIGMLLLMSISVNAQVIKINFPDANVSYYSKINNKQLIPPYLSEVSDLDSFGFIFDEYRLNNIYYCSSEDSYKVCDRLSSTNRTCYTIINGIEEGDLCSNLILWQKADFDKKIYF